jgi:N-glycosylase/DNA lyase
VAAQVTIAGQKPTLVPLDGQLFDLQSTLFSGQTFRWRKEGEWYDGVVFGNVIRLRTVDGGIEFISSPDDEHVIAPHLRDYFSLDIDLDEVYVALSRDENFTGPIEKYRGMRVLRQDPWETTLSFLCAQNSNVQRITKNVEDLCETFGLPVTLGEHTRHTYPTPESLANAGEQAIRDLGLGYRARFITSVAAEVAEGKTDLWALREAEYDEALDVLTSLNGIGDKVANCIMLFSMDKPEAFPVDTHIAKGIAEWYTNSDAAKTSDTQKMRAWAQARFGRHAGYANHYLFHSRRLAPKP